MKHSFFNDTPHIMGIVNVTPDSFSDGGQYFSPDAAIEHGLSLIEQGAHSLDIGGESTRPGSNPVSPEEEIRRIVPVIEGLRDKVTHISVDTRYPQTMEAALQAGAGIINDISGLTHDPRSVDIIAEHQVPVIVMHMQGQPKSMQEKVNYNNVMDDVMAFFEGRLEIFGRKRIEKELLVFDPGIGFGKNDEHNLLIIRNIKEFLHFDVPLLLGTSRKSFISRITGDTPVDKRLPGSLASVLWGLDHGVQFFRVHDGAETHQAFTIHNAIKNAGE
ncbi:MAG TPA: dihydropteroate synthase [Rhodospirillaceae bacterium]|nr:dihydropteroate synthase [Rhodospirillaceae bacterium]